MSGDAVPPAKPPGVRFGELGAMLLWCVPEAGCELGALLRWYAFLNRDAVPGYDAVAETVDRAVQVGFLLPSVSGVYRLVPEKFAWVHRRDNEFNVSEYAMFEFAEDLPEHDWPGVAAGYTLDRGEYERAAVAGQR